MRVVAELMNVIATYNELFWLYRWINIFLEKKENMKARVVDKFADRIISCIYVFLVIGLNRIELTSAYTMIFLMISNVVLVILLWKSDIVQSLAVVGWYFFLLFLVGNIEISITGIIGGEKLVRLTTIEQGYHRIVYVMAGCAIWYLINKCGIKHVGKRTVAPRHMKYWVGVTIVGFGGSAFIGTVLVNSFSSQIGIIWYVFLMLILLILLVSNLVIKQKEEQLKMEILRTQNEMLERNYKQVNEFYTANAKLYHDMNHHLTALYHLLQRGEEQAARKYIEGLQRTDNYNQIKIQSGINVLDAVLYETEKRAEKKNIMFMAEVPMLPCDLGIAGSDICSLFANLLENALDAAVKEVILRVKRVNQTLLITIRNDYMIEPIRREKRFVTQKTDKGIHGWGTQIVEEIVHKYEGNIDYEIQEGYFTVHMLLNESRG